MKKYVIGAIIGICLSLSVNVYAEEVKSLIGRTIEGQFPVKVNDKQLDNQAIVIDGTSYLPVRAVGDALNMEVGFNADLGITLQNKPKTAISEVSPTVISSSKIVITPFDYRNYRQDTANSELNKVNGELEYSYSVLNVLQRGYNGALDSLNRVTNEPDKEYHQNRVNTYLENIRLQETKIAELEAKKTQLETGTP